MVFVHLLAIQSTLVLVILDTLELIVVQKVIIVIQIHVKTLQIVFLAGQCHMNANVQ
jgi:hypothetical protein